MLTYPILAVLCLAALWTTALLVAASALGELRALRALAACLRPLGRGESGVGLVEGEVEDGGEHGEPLAVHEILQVGRALDGPAQAVVFRDRTHTSRVCGGTVRTGQGSVVRVAADSERASVWTSHAARDDAAACVDAGAFDAAYEAAGADGGVTRRVVTCLRRGDRVFVSGLVSLSGEEGARVVRAPDGGVLLVAAEDPRVFVRGRIRLVLLFVVAELLACAICTRLATWAPAFGSVSTLGGALCLAFFLAVTPVGVWVRDRCRAPDRAFLHGTWLKRTPSRGRAADRAEAPS
jgi:hypothetical protein